MIQALVRARIPYLPVHADHIDRDAAQFSLLVLPNLALITKEQVAAIRRFVDRGGSLVATGDTSLFDEMGDPRSDYALSDIFGAHLTIQCCKAARPLPKKWQVDAYHTYLRLDS